MTNIEIIDLSLDLIRRYTTRIREHQVNFAYIADNYKREGNDKSYKFTMERFNEMDKTLNDALSGLHDVLIDVMDMIDACDSFDNVDKAISSAALDLALGYKTDKDFE